MRAAPGWRSHPVETLTRCDATGPLVGRGGVCVLGCLFVTTPDGPGDGANPPGRGRRTGPPSRAAPARLGRAVPAQGGADPVGALTDPAGTPLPAWFPAPMAGAARSCSSCSTAWAKSSSRSAGPRPRAVERRRGPITSVAPSTTACALTTLVTGRVPAEHGVVGYRVALDGDVMNVLQWSVRGVDVRMSVPASRFSRSSRSRAPPPGCRSSRARTTGRRGSPRRISATWTCTAGTRPPGS